MEFKKKSKCLLRFLFICIVVAIFLQFRFITFYDNNNDDDSYHSAAEISVKNAAEISVKNADELRAEVVVVQPGDCAMYCDRKRMHLSAPCMCYADFYSTSGAPFTSSTAAGLFEPNSVKCAMTFVTAGRLGNQMGMYATLLVLARLNRRPALIVPRMDNFLRPYFRISLPVLTNECSEKQIWSKIKIKPQMEQSYRNFSEAFIKINGFPRSNRYFEGGFEEEIRREFRFKDELRDRAQKVLKEIASNRTTSSVTFVGVHVRRGDYVRILNRKHNAVVADRTYFSQATAYFRSQYNDAVFVVVSNDMQWCKENIDDPMNDVFFEGNGNESDQYSDLALLVSCNHSIITIGSYGFFAGFLAGGQVVYFSNFIKEVVPGKVPLDFQYPKHWHAIAATNFSSLDNVNVSGI